jgi:hypothetical protein
MTQEVRSVLPAYWIHHRYSTVAESHRVRPATPREQLTGLIYELLDAHADTQRLLQDSALSDLSMCVHLDYLRDLQRVAHGILAHVG